MKAKYIPVFSAGLIFLGFVLNQGYYYHFGLNITNYFTTGELILSFLDVLLIAVISIFYILYFLFFQLKQYERKYSVEEKRKVKEKEELKFDENKIKVKSANKIREKFKILFQRIDQVLKKSENLQKKISQYILLGLLIGITIAYLKGYFLKKSGFDESASMFFLISFIWILIILVNFNKSFEKSLKSKILLEEKKDDLPSTTPRWIIFSIAFFCFCISLWAYSSFKAFTVLDNNPTYEFEIKIKDDLFESSENLIFIGQSLNYLFIRELSSEKNIIIGRNKVEFFSLKKIQKEKAKSERRNSQKIKLIDEEKE